MPQVPATSADSLLREALAALDTCITKLMRVDERARTLAQETDDAHRTMRQRLNDFGLPNPGAGPNVHLPARPSEGPYAVDHEAIYRDELALLQAAVRLRSLDGKLDYLVNLLRSGRAQVLGSDPNELAAAPWAAAVRAGRIEAQEEERMRLAREVHDGPAQVLANAILGLEYCDMVATRAPSELSAELQRLRTTMREGLLEVRRFMFDLRPTMLASMGLNATLYRYSEDFQAAFPITVTLSLPPHTTPIDDSAQIAIFRVVQESLQNVQKHSEASTVRIELTPLDDGSLCLRVSDNGRGFDHARVRPTSRSGAGLVGMEERAAMLDGSLTIESSLGRGTTVILQLPPRDDTSPPGPLIQHAVGRA